MSGEFRPIVADFPAGIVSSPTVIAEQEAIVFRLTNDQESDLYTLSLESNRIQRLTFNAQEEEYVSVSPAGNWITWSYELEGAARRIYGSEINFDAPNRLSARRLTNGPDDQVQFFSSVSPDGNWLFYDATVGGQFVILRQSLSNSQLPPEQLTTAGSE
ncbi:MAG: hypothetical protein DHS20C06_15980 [Hyphobacterium sp.]|nr:MAG: hypothetical protein DHS20C06_15980 [Hyphobacterium sp.]